MKTVLEDSKAVQSKDAKEVAILLCTMNGRDFLAEQLGSIAAQTHSRWKLWVSDDGSTDDSQNVVRGFSRQWGENKVALVAGPSKGFATNFLSLACRPEIAADYYAFADQDDVWEVDRLSRALAWLETISPETPALYCGRTLLIAEDGAKIGISPLYAKTPSFANALVECLAGGNTMVFNNAARKLLQVAGSGIKVVSHDWWLYLLVSACDGTIFYDTDPTVRYRQHGGNMISSKTGLKARLAQSWEVFQGGFRERTATNVLALGTVQSLFSQRSTEIFQRFAAARQRSILLRCLGILRSGVYRQTVTGNVGLMLACLLGKI